MADLVSGGPRISEAAMHENYAYALRRVGTLADGSALAEIGPWWLMYSGLPEARFNTGVLKDEPANADQAIALAEAWFVEQGAETVRLDLRSEVDLLTTAAAEARGYERWWAQPAMSLAPLPTAWRGVPELAVRRVETEADMRSFARLEAEEHQDHAFQIGLTRNAMRLPGCVLFIGEQDGQCVARSMAVVRDGVVGVHNVYVRPPLRRRGYGAAVTAAAVDAGRELGATAACLEATELGEPVYRRMGFVRRYDYITMGRRLTGY